MTPKHRLHLPSSTRRKGRSPLPALALLVTMFFAFSACKNDTEDEVTPDGSSSGTAVAIDTVSTVSAAAEGNTGNAADDEDILANASFTSVVAIDFGATVSVTNPLAGSGVTITESNGDVTVTATATGVEYIVSGTTTNGSLKVYSDKKFKLTLDGANITNNDGPAINIQSGKRVFVVLNDNTTNTLTDAATYVASGTEDMKGTFFSEGQLIFSGNGSLTVNANYKHGIASDDYVRVISGNITIAKAASDGIHTNDAYIGDGGTVKITASGDGIQVDEGYIVINNGSYTLNIVDKGLAAKTESEDPEIDPYLTINGGTINVTSSAGEGIESKSILTINGGNIVANTKDDAINASDFIYINGGTTYAFSTGNDGIDSNGPITVTGGVTVAVGAASPEQGFDCDRSTFKVTGGILVGIGGGTSTPTTSVSTQPSVILGSGTANQLFHIQSSEGAEVLTFLVPKSYSTMLFSTPKVKVGTSYKVFTGGSVTGGNNVNGIYTSGTYNAGTQSSTFTASSMVTSAGGSTGSR